MSANIVLDGGPRVAAPRRARRSRPPAPALKRPRWETRYARATMGVDVAGLVVAVTLGGLLGLGDHAPGIGDLQPTIGIVVVVLTVACLRTTRAWEPRVLGQGSEEFSRLLRGFVTSAVLIGLTGLALQLAAIRPWVFGLVPLAGLLAAAGRMALRKWLHRQRDRGVFLHQALAVGTVESVTDLITRTRRDPYNGWEVTGACTPTGTGVGDAMTILDVPVRGDLDSVAQVAIEGQHRVVSLGPTPGFTPRRLHQLAWDLEDVGADLVVDPGLMEVAGPRLHVAPVDGLPMLRLTRPSLTGVSWLIKYMVDRVGALLLVVLTAPVMIAIALAVRADGGPVLFRQVRVGRHGSQFSMLKFRSMIVDAEQRRADLEQQNDGAGPLFKMRNDPRVTRVGALLRRYSLDELPQLFNVIAGSMSLIGPRPPLPSEVATYARDAQRKLLVKPGLTGLWQISGRSDLSWEESVRLDLRYVENWSLALDALILWKTFSAVIRSSGAY